MNLEESNMLVPSAVFCTATKYTDALFNSPAKSPLSIIKLAHLLSESFQELPTWLTYRLALCMYT